MTSAEIDRKWHPENFEVHKEVKQVRAIMPCPKCSDGQMEFTGTSYLTYPAQNVHKCNKCGYSEEYVGATYPTLKYIEV